MDGGAGHLARRDGHLPQAGQRLYRETVGARRDRTAGLHHQMCIRDSLDRLLVVVGPDGQLEIMIRRFGLDRCDHRHETRQVELERGGVLHLRAHRKPEGFQSCEKYLFLYG